MNKNILAVALASLLVGGVAVAAYNSFRGNDTQPTAFTTVPDGTLATSLTGDLAANGAIDGQQDGRVEYADVLNVKPINEKQAMYATVIGTEPVRETSTTSSPREVCEDVVVQQRAPVKDPNRIVGTVAGVLIGGALGNQVGGGDGKKVATAAGAVGGAYAGRAIQNRQQQNRTVAVTERQCRTVQSSSQSSRVVAYNVTYRNPDGTTGTMRTGSKPGNRISLGSENQVVGYDVTYRYQGQEQTVRLDERPGQRLPVIDGQVVTQTAAAAVAGTTRG